MLDFNQVARTLKLVILVMFAVGCVFCLSEVQSLSQQQNAIREHKCAVPQPRTISFESRLNQLKSVCENYNIPIAVLHRCDFASGCCIGYGGRIIGTCGPIKSQNVTLVFDIIQKKSPFCHGNSSIRRVTIEAENHTRCSCIKQ